MNKAALIVAQAALSLLSMASEAKAENPMNFSSPLSSKTCTSVLAGMYNDAKAEPGVVVAYTGITLTLVGNGREYFVSCRNDEMKFVGKIMVGK